MYIHTHILINGVKAALSYDHSVFAVFALVVLGMTG
jgi:hypothetical protein